jgi:PAS domain-containing protein
MKPASEHKPTLVSRALEAAKDGALELQTPFGPATEPLGQRPLYQGRTAREEANNLNKGTVMNKNQDQPASAAALRRRAEERLQAREQTPQSAIRNPQSAQRLVHELQVHQIELEMQNEELQQARAKIEVLLAEYYEFAPTGYFNLAADGTILAVNLTGARLLGIERARLLNRRFGLLVSEADRPDFNAFLAKTIAGMDRQVCEVALLKAETAPLFVHVEAVVSESRRECRVAMMDVTDRRQIEADRNQLIRELQQALASVKSLSGLLPICAHCKRIRDDQGYWEEVEAYVSSHTQATFTHGICPECSRKIFSELNDHAPAAATPGTPAEKSQALVL